MDNMYSGDQQATALMRYDECQSVAKIILSAKAYINGLSARKYESNGTLEPINSSKNKVCRDLPESRALYKITGYYFSGILVLLECLLNQSFI